MKEIYKLKEDLLELYRNIGLPLIIVSRIAIALVTVMLINQRVGAMEALRGLIVMFGVSIIAGIVPVSLGTVILMCFTLGHLWAVSYVAATMVAIILTILFILGKLFSPQETYLFVASFIMCLMGGIYAVPLVLAMLGSVMGVVPMLGGVVWFGMITMIGDMKEALVESSITDGIFIVLEGIMNNTTLLLTLLALALSYVIATVMKSMSFNESWKCGLISAAAANIVVMVMGWMVTLVSVPYMSLLVGTLAGAILGLIIEIFVHNVDYRGAETLRFEDDEYFYYVKAIPKKDPPRELEDKELTRAELREQAREQARSQKKTSQSSGKGNGRKNGNQRNKNQNGRINDKQHFTKETTRY